jgi:hypothetical protein
VLLPYFESPLGIELSFNQTGVVSAAIAAWQPSGETQEAGVVVLERPGLLSLSLESIRLALSNRVVSLSLSGELTPRIGEIHWPSVSVDEFTIDSRGHVRIDGGMLDLGSTASFDFHGFKMEISKIGFGTDDDGTRWIGFSGGIHLVEGVPLGGSVEGLKIKWKGDDIGLELKGIGIEMAVPNALTVNGRVEFIDDGSRKGFKGGVKLAIIPASILVDAQFMIGKNSQVPAYAFAYGFLAGEFPGIPLGNSGLALFGLAGLVGYNVTPDKQPEESWFEGWYLRNPVGVSDVTKWRDERNAFALGAGATIGTAVDNGYAFHGQFLLALLIPGPVILLDGKSTFLTPRGGDPQMVSLAVFDGRAGTLLFNVQARYCYPSGGELLAVTASSEAFFDFGNPRTWHLYVGMDAPEEKRVRARVLSLWEANAFLMLDHDGVRMGAMYGYNGRWEYGPLKVVLEAWVAGQAAVGWSPPQMEGQLTLHGDVELRAFGFGAGLGLEVGIEVRAPHPYYVHGDLSVKLPLPWPLEDVEATIEFTWEQDVPPPTPRPLEALGLEHLKATETWSMGAAGDRGPVVPLDAHPVLSFQRRMSDHTGLASNALPPAPERSGQFLFQYHLDLVRLEKRASASGGWTDVSTPPAPSLPAGKIWSTWQALPSSLGEGGGPQGVPPMTKLMLWSRTPFDCGRDTIGAGTADGFVDGNPDWPCGYDWTPVWLWADFEDQALGRMQPISAAGELTIVAIGATIEDWTEVADWLPAKRAACLGTKGKGRARTKSRRAGSPPRIAFDNSATAQRRALLRIFFPPRTAAARLCLGEGTRGQVSVNGGAGKPLEYHRVALDPLLPEAGDLVYVELTGTVRVLRIEWTDRTEWDRTQAGGAFKQALASGAPDALGADPEILEPHMEYRLTVQTHVERSANDGESWDTVDAFVDEGYFRTGSPPGVDVGASAGELEPTDSSEHYPERGPLRDLRPYVLDAVPCDGTRPVYRSYDVGVEFNEPYTETMYLLDGKPLVLQVYDQNGQPVLDSAGQPSPTVNQWTALAPQAVSLRRSDAAWIDVLRRCRDRTDSACADVSGIKIPEPKGLWMRDPDLLLTPGMTHRAAVGSVVPAAVLPLHANGRVLMDENNKVICTALAGSVSSRLDSVSTASSGRKLLLTASSAIDTGLGAGRDAQPFDASNSDQVALVKAAIRQLRPACSDVRRVFDWTFTTSHFANFVHHLQSWPDVLRDLYADMGSPEGDLLSGEQQSWLEDLMKDREPGMPPRAREDDCAANAGREEEAQVAEKVLEVLGLDQRKLPEVMTVTLLRDAQRSYGIVVESPEPLPSNRVSLAMSHNIRPTESTLTSIAAAKLVGIGFGATDTAADLVTECVDLVLLRKAALNGMTLRLGDGAGGWEDYYTFAAAGSLPEGALIRVHTGSAEADTSPQTEVRHFYAQDAGGSANRRFAGSKIRVALVDAEGTAVHERTFLRRGFAEMTNYHILRNRDDTRVLLFFRQGRKAVGSVPSGTLRIVWRYARNISDTHPSAPILRRLGSDGPECTILDITVS